MKRRDFLAGGVLSLVGSLVPKFSLRPQERFSFRAYLGRPTGPDDSGVSCSVYDKESDQHHPIWAEESIDSLCSPFAVENIIETRQKDKHTTYVIKHRTRHDSATWVTHAVKHGSGCLYFVSDKERYEALDWLASQLENFKLEKHEDYEYYSLGLGVGLGLRV